MRRSEARDAVRQVASRIQHEPARMRHPGHLQLLLEILPPSPPPELARLVWDEGLLHKAVACLQLDVGKVVGGLDALADVCTLVARCAGGCTSKDLQVLEAVSALLGAAVSLPALPAPALASADERDDLLDEQQSALLTMLRAVRDICHAHPALLASAVNDPQLLALLMGEEAVLARTAILFVLDLNSANPETLALLAPGRANEFAEELVFRLVQSDDERLAEPAASLLLGLLRHQPATTDHLLAFAGLEKALSKWRGYAFDREVREIRAALAEARTRSVRGTEEARYHRAAVVVQRHWRGFNTRTRLQRASAAIARFQTMWRRKRDRANAQREHRLRDEREAELAEEQRRMARIAARQRDAELIAGLPADEVEAFLRRRQEQAAVDIQRMVRGHCARVAAARRRLDNKQHAAASTIQRSVRRHQARRRSEQTAAQTSAAGGYFLPPRPPLADSKHRELQQLIQHRREQQGRPDWSLAKAQATFNEAYSRLFARVRDSVGSRTEENCRDLVARLRADVDQLASARSLDEADAESACSFYRSAPAIVAKARASHNREMERISRSWWQAIEAENRQAAPIHHMQLTIEQHNHGH